MFFLKGSGVHLYPTAHDACDVEAEGGSSSTRLGPPLGGQAPDSALLWSGDGLERMTVIGGTTSLDLDDGDSSAFPHDEVEFAPIAGSGIVMPPIAIENLPTVS